MLDELVSLAKREVLTGCAQISAKGYVLGAAGNISARIGDRFDFVITPSGGNLDSMEEQDLVVVHENGEIEGQNKPSSEWMIHSEMYRSRQDVKAVIHTHSPNATAVSSLEGIDAVPIIDIEMVLHMGGEITVAPFEIPGTQQLALSAVKGLEEKMCVLLQHHGDVCVGKNMAQAIKCCDNAERSCDMLLKIMASSHQISSIPADYITKAKEIFSLRKQSGKA